MKNTKHTENLDNSTPQEITSQSKRKILTSIGVSSGILGASALSQQWTKPIVNSIILPAHAQSTPMMTTMMMTTMGMSTTKPAMDDMDMTTMMPTTATPAPASRIMVVAGQTGSTIGDESMAEFHISLTEQPMNDVMVTVSADPTGRIGTIAGGTGDDTDVFVFTRANYMDEQTVMLTAVEPAPDPAGVTIKFEAEGGGYDDEENSVMLTVVNNDDALPTDVKADGGAGTLSISWTKPDTSNPVERYIVRASRTALAPATIPTDNGTTGTGNAAVHTFNTSATSHTFDLAGKPGDYYYGVAVVFKRPTTPGVVEESNSDTAESVT